MASTSFGIKTFAKTCAVAALLFTAQSPLLAQAGWQFISGSTDVAQPGIFDEPAHPGARSNAAYATDGNGDLWVFGGEGYASTLNVLNDLWKYDTSERQWTLMAGTGDFMDQPSNYDPETGPLHPGSRWNAMAWADDAGDFWLFGGYGFGRRWNDFWKYDSSENEWLLISGTGNYENQRAQINPPTGVSHPGSRQTSTVWKDTSGDFWMYGGTGLPPQGPALFLNDLWRYDTSAEIWVHEAGTTTFGNQYGNQDPALGDLDPGSRRRASGWSDSSGDLWLFGGTGYVGGEVGTYSDLWKFDTSTKKWLIVSGTSAIDQYANLDPTQGPLRPGGRFGASSWMDEADNLWLFGGLGFGEPGTWQVVVNDLWRYDTGDNEWHFVSGTGDFGRQNGVYSGSSQHPGSRDTAAAGYDGNGGLWLFGGLGMSENAGADHLNDLWKYEIHPQTPVPTTTVSGAAYVNPNTLSITFSAAMDSATVQVAAHYTISGPGAGDRTSPATVTAGTNPNEYLLTWTSGSFGYGETLTVTASASILDAGGLGLIDPREADVSVPEGEWQFVGGTGNYLNQPGVYPDSSQPNLLTYPGSRRNSTSWTDPSGNLWIYGGFGNIGGSTGFLADMWKFDIEHSEWELVAGYDDNLNVAPSYSSPAHPGSRSGASGWSDNDGNYWLFGGSIALTVGTARTNDLWKYEVSTNEWICVFQETGFESVYPPAGNVYPGRRENAASWIDEQNDLWLFGGFGNTNSGVGNLNDLWKFDTSEAEWVFVARPATSPNQPGVYPNPADPGLTLYPGSRTQSATWTDSDGNHWLFGGQGRAATGATDALNDLWKFNVDEQRWEFVSGTGDYLNEPGVYPNPADPALLVHPGSGNSAFSWVDADGNFWLFGGVLGSGQLGFQYRNDLWKFDPSILQWALISRSGGGINQDSIYPDSPSAGVNVPGSRSAGAAWVGGDGDLWVFGGLGYATLGQQGVLNDLWKYNLYGNDPVTDPEPGETRIASAAFVDRNSISVTFNGPMAPTGGVLEPTNYRISGPGAGTRVGAPAPPPTAPAPAAGGLTARWADHTPTPANPATVEYLGGNTYRLTWTSGQFVSGQPLIIHVDDEHILDASGDLLGAPNFITLMIPFDAPGCICPAP